MRSVSVVLLVAFAVMSSVTARADHQGEPGWGTYADARCEFGGDKDSPESVCQAHVTACLVSSTQLCQSRLLVVCEEETVFSGGYEMEVGSETTKVTGVLPPPDVDTGVNGAPVILADRKDVYPAKVKALLTLGEERFKGRCLQRLLTGPDFPDGI